MIDIFALIHQYYSPHDLNYQILIQHSTLVTGKAVSIAKKWNKRHVHDQVDIEFIAEAGMLHDIGILEVNAPEIGCFGMHPYVYHIVSGYTMLQQHNLDRHARVALSHTGVGIFPDEVVSRNLPLPRDLEYFPNTLEEKIISYADLFFSKGGLVFEEKSVDDVRTSLERFGERHIDLFDQWHTIFAVELLDL